MGVRGEGVSWWDTSSKSSWTKKVEPPDERERCEGETEEETGESGRGRSDGSAGSSPLSNARKAGGEKGACRDPDRGEENLLKGVEAGARLPCPS